ncbi:amidohydrolase family protein [Sphingomonas sp. C8-2]|jgi:N-acyl-D-aspartate/D-glutamate deacylase|nr:amidohydrolase family protein [Sphingomonas sp. C8-2]
MAAIDLIIRNGLVHDGEGGEPRLADVALRNGVIVGVGKIDGPADEEIDATGCIVTPGFIDVHTHYDGQLIWSQQMIPSSCHGVTTVVAGNCGVGFAPCRPGDQALLISAMEGVEDIPEVVMTEGLTWEWETFPQLLDAMESRAHDVDFALYLPHSALRIYAMGARGADREPASEADLAEMGRLVHEAMEVGAMGFATSSIEVHRRVDGQPIPSFEAAEDELKAMARAIGRNTGGLFQMVPDFQQVDEADTRALIEMLARISEAGGVPLTFTLVQSDRYPDRWRKVLDWVSEANRRPGVELRPQIFPRPVGMLLSHGTSNNPFLLCPSYEPLLKLSFEERLERLRDPALRARLIAEEPGDPTYPLSVFGRMFDRMFVLGDPPNYEPRPEENIAARARAMGISPAELAYDLLLEQGGRNWLFVGFINFGDGTLDFVSEMADHPDTLLGLGDGGAHYGLICDATYTTFMLTHWTRDRAGARMSLPRIIKAMTKDSADLLGLADRGRIAVGYKADINVIDYEKLRLNAPEVRFDLPAGGRRLHQGAEGYRWTIVAGQPIMRDGEPTGRLPGRLVRRNRASSIAGATAEHAAG